MARARFERLPVERRNEILDTAAAAFAAGGFEGTSYNRILEAAALPKSSAYYLFDGKVDLYAAVLDREAERLVHAVRPPTDPTDPASFWVETRRWLEASVGFLAANPQSARLLTGWLDAQRAGLVNLDTRIGAVMEQAVVGFVASGRAAGAVRDDVPEALLVALVGAVLATMDHHFLPTLAAAEPSAAAAAIDLYLDTLDRLLAPGQELARLAGARTRPAS